MDLKTHAHFIEISAELSPALADEIREIGPISFPDRKYGSLPRFLARVVVGQQLSFKAARTIWGRIEEARKESGNRIPNFFCEENSEAIRGCGLSRNKTKALIHIREAHEAGALSRAKVRAMDHDDRSSHLSAIWGVGQWSCDMASMFYFQDPDVWPDGDITVRNTFARYIGRKKPEKAAARFAPYRSYLALYMWRIVDGMP